MRFLFPSTRTPRRGAQRLTWLAATALLVGPSTLARLTAQDEATAARLIGEERAIAPAAVDARVAKARAALAELADGSTSETARRVHLALGEALLDAGDARAAHEHLERGCALARAQGATRSLAFGLLHAGIASDRIGAFATAVDEAAESTRLAAQLGERRLEFSAANLLGATNERRSERQAALVAWNHCVELAEAIGDANATCTVLNNMSVLLLNAGQLDRAFEKLVAARRAAEGAGLREALAAIVANQGDIELLRCRPAAARTLHEEAVTLREELGAPSAIALARTRLGDTLLALGEPRLAIAELEPALATQRRRGLVPEVAATLACLARAHAALDHPAEALSAAHQGLELTQAIEGKAKRVSVLLALAEAQAAAGEHAKALDTARDAFRLDEEVDSLEMSAAFAAREAGFESEARERRIALLETERALQASRLAREELWRNVLLFGAAGLVVIALLGWSLFLHRRRALAALAETVALQERMTEARKLESVALVAGGLAHDFNNLLTGVIGNVRLARNATPGSADVDDRLDDIEEACRRAASLAADMLTISGRATVRRERIDVGDLLTRTVRLVRGVFPRRTFALVVEPGLPAIDADPVQLGRVIHNLATNAAEALGESEGAVRVEARIVPAGESGGARGVELAVADCGPGVPEEVRARLFEPFVSTKPKGRGLGLATAHGIVQRHMGSITVDSDPLRGTVFRVRLPVDGEPAQVPPPAATGRGERTTVLVIDDDEAVRTATAHLLERLGCHALTAVDGSDGVARVERFGATIDLILLDFALPGMTGAETLTRLRAVAPDTPVILATGYDRDAALQQAGEVDHLLQKPFTLPELRVAVQAAMARPRTQAS